MPALTELAVKSAKPHTTLWDSTLPGFGLRCGANRKTFIVLIASGRRQSLGHWPLVSLSEARSEAKRLLAEKALGRVRPTATAFCVARDDFLRECGQRIKPRTVRDYKRLLERHFPFGRVALSAITPRDIIKRMNALNATPSEKHHAVLAGRIFFRWCVRQHLLDRSPMEHVAVPLKHRARERALHAEELAAVLKCARSGSTTFHRIVELLIYTGQRRSEIGGMRWDFIGDDRTITFPASYTKNKRTHQFPIGQLSVDVLYSIPRISDTYVFPATREHDHGRPTSTWNGWGKGKLNFDRECPIAAWTLHDLRRTFSSGMAALGVPQVVVEKLLNHVSGGTTSPIAAVYNRHQYMNEMREAVVKYEQFLGGLLDATDGR
jgi:integrase